MEVGNLHFQRPSSHSASPQFHFIFFGREERELNFYIYINNHSPQHGGTMKLLLHFLVINLFLLPLIILSLALNSVEAMANSPPGFDQPTTTIEMTKYQVTTQIDINTIRSPAVQATDQGPGFAGNNSMSLLFSANNQEQHAGAAHRMGAELYAIPATSTKRQSHIFGLENSSLKPLNFGMNQPTKLIQVTFAYRPVVMHLII